MTIYSHFDLGVLQFCTAKQLTQPVSQVRVIWEWIKNGGNNMVATSSASIFLVVYNFDQPFSVKANMHYKVAFERNVHTC